MKHSTSGFLWRRSGYSFQSQNWRILAASRPAKASRYAGTEWKILFGRGVTYWQRKVSYIGGSCKISSLFLSLLKHLKVTYRRAETTTLIVDNYIIHKSRETLCWLKANPKLSVIYQPVYSTCVNHVDQLWQALHDTKTRKHQCRRCGSYWKKVRYLMETASPFPGGKPGLAKE